MDEDSIPQNREKLNSLSDKLDQAIRNRREANKKAALDRMRSALKGGRNGRNHDLEQASLDMFEAEMKSREGGPGGKQRAQEFFRQIDVARSRGMLARDVFETRDSKGKMVSREAELAEINGREKYQKRPSVRASKKQRSSSRGMSI